MYCTYVRLCTVISGQEVGIMLIDSRSSSAAFYPNEVPRILQRHQMKAKTNVSKAKSRRGFTLVEMIVVIGMIAALAGISFPVYKGIQKKVERQQFEMALASIERAVDNYETEYNYLPTAGGADNWDGEHLSTVAQMTTFITILAGAESVANPVNFKGISFLDGTPEAKAQGGGFAFFNYEKGWGVSQSYDPRLFEQPEFSWSPVTREVHLVLVTRPVELAPGESFSYWYAVRFLYDPPQTASAGP